MKARNKESDMPTSRGAGVRLALLRFYGCRNNIVCVVCKPWRGIFCLKQKSKPDPEAPDPEAPWTKPANYLQAC